MTAPDLEVTQVLTASPAAVASAWSSPETIEQWWGPAGFTSTVRELRFTDGGVLDIVMRSPDGAEFSNVYDFQIVDLPSRIEYAHRGSVEWGLSPSRTVVLIASDPRDPKLTRVSWLSYYATDEDRRKHLEESHAEAGARELLGRLESVAASLDRRAVTDKRHDDVERQ
ncbi:SRPBCC domain-containing protein [Mycolicibacterium brumae]|uniref:Activator of Hsp90 ATPase homologue 1/2-like C-terminal domain-containing protein n=1 Tax=Mycolicibacterium brumae TaxID=85968 RepID=A0A2G5PEN2_9MYCO|nr:SRPBCC domain-containing protein [Mycolicibacterium brumae]MCV7192024.1 SRPBCC domain-containing protein [Mycolicibacterium brumae]PIB76772.1 hypothetical protein CQY22_003745 [Mycolicibacterium brumae]UWW07790.1 SRPBCC domain-containing protein [Mycolicibacterium brumae]